jgi:hypothetical protein
MGLCLSTLSPLAFINKSMGEKKWVHRPFAKRWRRKPESLGEVGIEATVALCQWILIMSSPVADRLGSRCPNAESPTWPPRRSLRFVRLSRPSFDLSHHFSDLLSSSFKPKSLYIRSCPRHRARPSPPSSQRSLLCHFPPSPPPCFWE